MGVQLSNRENTSLPSREEAVLSSWTLWVLWLQISFFWRCFWWSQCSLDLCSIFLSHVGCWRYATKNSLTRKKYIIWLGCLPPFLLFHACCSQTRHAVVWRCSGLLYSPLQASQTSSSFQFAEPPLLLFCLGQELLNLSLLTALLHFCVFFKLFFLSWISYMWPYFEGSHGHPGLWRLEIKPTKNA